MLSDREQMSLAALASLASSSDSDEESSDIGESDGRGTSTDAANHAGDKGNNNDAANTTVVGACAIPLELPAEFRRPLKRERSQFGMTNAGRKVRAVEHEVGSFPSHVFLAVPIDSEGPFEALFRSLVVSGNQMGAARRGVNQEEEDDDDQPLQRGLSLPLERFSSTELHVSLSLSLIHI